GKDAAVLTITDANGVILTDSQYIKDCSFHIVESDTYLTRRTNTFTAIDNGTYTIEGMYLGKSCVEPVSITAENRSKYEVFSKKVAIYRITSIGCQYCPSMTEALASVDAFTKDHSVVLAFHGVVGYDPYALKEGNSYLAERLLSQFNTNAYPFAIYSLSTGSSSRVRSEIMGFVMDELVNHPAATGIAADTKIEANLLTVTASVKASVGGTYDLGFALLQSGLDGEGKGYEEQYDNVVRVVSGNYRGMSDKAFVLEAGAEKKDIVFSEIGIDSSLGLDVYTIVLFTLVKDENGSVRIDNVVSMPINGSIQYVYNE
ncbi:MAG: hypothetical protein ACI39U_01155, partial [Candidatus Cryptobacteroides sp.]